MKGSALAGRVRWALDFVGLTDRRHDRVQNYSGGMKRRLNLAAALLHAPALLLLDEPTVGVDPQSRNSIFDNIEALREAGHDDRLHDALHGGSGAALRSRGDHRSRQAARARHRARPARRRTAARRRWSSTNGDDERRIATADPLAELNRLAAAGAAVTSFHVERPTLEQVFLNLTGRSLRD